jgi:hypothetical protein
MVPVLALSVALQLANPAHVPAATLRLAEDDVVRVYRGIGVDVSWSRPDPVRDHATIHVVVIEEETSALQRRPHTVMGAALRTPQGTALAYIFYRRVESQSMQHAVAISAVLACAIAHEVAHLLLPDGLQAGHSTVGLMRPIWNREDFQRADRGELRLEPQQARSIRRSLRSGAAAD